MRKIVLGITATALAIGAMAFAPSVATADVNFDFFTSDGGFTVVNDGIATGFMWDASTAWTTNGVEGGNDNPSNNTYLSSPNLTVQSTGDVGFSFTHAYSFEGEWDAGGIFYSINGGAFDNYLEMPDYSNTQALQGSHALNGRNGYTGDSAGYPTLITSGTTIGGLNAGDTIAVQFVGGWDQFALGNNQPEWIIGSASFTNAIPEPATGGCLLLGLVGTVLIRRRKG